MRRAVWVGVLSVWCALPAAPSDTGPAASAPPAPPSAPVLLGEIFERQLGLLDTLKLRLGTLTKQNERLSGALTASQTELDSAQLTLRGLELDSARLKASLAESDKALRSLQESLQNSEGSLSAAQSSLRRAERDRWLWAAAAMLAGVILGAVIL